jgi:hypothetical protein
MPFFKKHKCNDSTQTEYEGKKDPNHNDPDFDEDTFRRLRMYQRRTYMNQEQSRRRSLHRHSPSNSPAHLIHDEMMTDETSPSFTSRIRTHSAPPKSPDQKQHDRVNRTKSDSDVTADKRNKHVKLKSSNNLTEIEKCYCKENPTNHEKHVNRKKIL